MAIRRFEDGDPRLRKFLRPDESYDCLSLVRWVANDSLSEAMVRKVAKQILRRPMTAATVVGAVLAQLRRSDRAAWLEEVRADGSLFDSLEAAARLEFPEL